MIILQVSTITDWIQAVAAIIAIVGVIISFCLLIKDNKDKQNQIDKLAELAIQSNIANELFKSQLEEDKRRHKLSIKPKFELCFINDKSFNQRHYTLRNVGRGDAQNIVIERVTKSSIKTLINKYSFINYLLKDKTAEITFEPKKELSNAPSLDRFEVNTNIYFKDIDGNMYSQLISGQHIEDNVTFRYLQLNEPIEIELDSPESEGFVL